MRRCALRFFEGLDDVHEDADREELRRLLNAVLAEQREVLFWQALTTHGEQVRPTAVPPDADVIGRLAGRLYRVDTTVQEGRRRSSARLEEDGGNERTLLAAGLLRGWLIDWFFEQLRP